MFINDFLIYLGEIAVAYTDDLKLILRIGDVDDSRLIQSAYNLSGIGL